jgi:hypothetical protein
MTAVACLRTGRSNSTEIFSLRRGLLAKTTKGCPSTFTLSLTTKGTNAVWLDCSQPHRVAQLSGTGTFTQSKPLFSGAAPVSALHQIVVSNRTRSQLLGLKTPTSQPRRIL